jgi:hypothetical protein
MLSLHQCAALFVFLGTFASSAQTPAPRFEYWPGTQYDPAVPTAKQVLGFDLGERIVWSNQAVQYLEALAKASPQRIKVVDYGKSWEGRRLVYAIIGSEANMRRLPEVQAGMKKLHDPRTIREADARKLIADLPAITWLAYVVHGNETSGTDAALMTAYHLLAAKGDAMIDKILANTLVMIDPTQNPDGRDRFVHHYEINEGLQPDAEAVTAEHIEQWPGGRVNHYMFDMNRDWTAVTQPETHARIKLLQEWYPLIFADLHEMGSDSLYYFAPDAVPYNPHLTKDQKEMLNWFGKNNGKHFDKFGFSYFTREVFDAFYPGYGASWPAYFGSLAMTYENGSVRGLTVRRSDEVTIDYKYAVRRHFTASVATCETAAIYRQQLLENFWKYGVSAVDEGSKEQPFILPRRGNVANVDKLAQLLVEQGVEVKRATSPVQGYPAGSYVIPLNQPAKRLARTLLDKQVSMDDNFLKAEERRRTKRLNSEIYDVTAWSLPIQFGVECVQASVAVSGAGFDNVKFGDTHKGTVKGTGSVAYLVPWNSNYAGQFLTAALKAGLRVHSTDKPFQLSGVTYPAGTIIVKTAENPASLRATITQLADSTGADVTGVDTSWVDDGPNFGSRYVSLLKKPRIALAWDRPTSANAAGATRFVIERQFGYPVSVIRTPQFATADLSRFNVIILPDGGGFGGETWATAFNPVAVRKLKEWVQSGGTLIGIGSALQFLGDPRNGFLSLQQEGLATAAAGTETRRTEGSAPAQPEPRTTQGKILAKEEDYVKAIQPDNRQPDSLHGILARAKMDPDHWLSSGAGEIVHTMVAGRTIYAPVKADKGVNVGVYVGADQVMASGYIWDDYRKQLAYKPFLVAQKDGRGNLIGFTADPNYRAYMDGLNLIFLNAVFRGPAH